MLVEPAEEKVGEKGEGGGGEKEEEGWKTKAGEMHRELRG